ncbi:MAG TPA: hypothetical protein VMQ10_16255 [Spirochaetia bacterium]|nr:hypothetical protein [Spirochaetia bacterium]
MAKRSVSFDAITVLQIVVAVFLFTLGLIGLVDWNSSLAQFGRSVNRFFGRADNPLNLIVAVVEMAAGVIVFIALFITVANRLIYVLTLIIAILWVVEIIVAFFGQDPFKPDFLVWLNRFAADVIILLSLWLINRKYA